MPLCHNAGSGHMYFIIADRFAVKVRSPLQIIPPSRVIVLCLLRCQEDSFHRTSPLKLDTNRFSIHLIPRLGHFDVKPQVNCILSHLYFVFSCFRSCRRSSVQLATPRFLRMSIRKIPIRSFNRSSIFLIPTTTMTPSSFRFPSSAVMILARLRIIFTP